jgi:hypothetical protein
MPTPSTPLSLSPNAISGIKTKDAILECGGKGSAATGDTALGDFQVSARMKAVSTLRSATALQSAAILMLIYRGYYTFERGLVSDV